MKVRALPTWRNPVGEGAKRTRGRSSVGKSIIFVGQGNLSLDVTVEEKQRQGHADSQPGAKLFCRLGAWHRSSSHMRTSAAKAAVFGVLSERLKSCPYQPCRLN